MTQTQLLFGVNNKTPFLQKQGFNAQGSFAWAWGSRKEHNIKNEKQLVPFVESMFIRCKDHLVDCFLSTTGTNNGLGYTRETTQDMPITLFVKIPTSSYTKEKALEEFKEGIERLLHPLEQKNKWKKTTVSYIDTYKEGASNLTTNEWHLFEVTASKMWKRNGFLLSLWTSLLRLGFFSDSKVDINNLIDSVLKQDKTHCNEYGYIKSISIIPNINKVFQEILNNLNIFKTKYEYISAHADLSYRTHGADGIFHFLNYVSYIYTYKDKLYEETVKKLVKSNQFFKEINDYVLRYKTGTVS